MRDFAYNAPPIAAAPRNSKAGAQPNIATQLQARSHSSLQTDIGSIGDYILTDFLLGDVDLDTFVRVEAHYMSALQRKVLRVWSAGVEDRTGQFK